MLASEEENEGVFSRGTNSTLGLSAVLALEVTPNISLPCNEHLNLLPSLVFGWDEYMKKTVACQDSKQSQDKRLKPSVADDDYKKKSPIMFKIW